jgi:hypothetical protein
MESGNLLCTPLAGYGYGSDDGSSVLICRGSATQLRNCGAGWSKGSEKERATRTLRRPPRPSVACAGRVTAGVLDPRVGGRDRVRRRAASLVLYRMNPFSNLQQMRMGLLKYMLYFFRTFSCSNSCT